MTAKLSSSLASAATTLRRVRFMGIEHKPRPDGSLAVLRAHVERVLGGVVAAERMQKKTEPNWAALEKSERRKAEKKAKK